MAPSIHTIVFDDHERAAPAATVTVTQTVTPSATVEPMRTYTYGQPWTTDTPRTWTRPQWGSNPPTSAVYVHYKTQPSTYCSNYNYTRWEHYRGLEAGLFFAGLGTGILLLLIAFLIHKVRRRGLGWKAEVKAKVPWRRNKGIQLPSSPVVSSTTLPKEDEVPLLANSV